MLVRQSAAQKIDFHGLEILDYTAGRPLSSSLAVIKVGPGVRHPAALSRRSDKYYWVSAGCLHFSIKGREFDLDRGDFCLVPQGREFWYENRTEEPVELLLVHTPDFDPGAEVMVGDVPVGSSPNFPPG